MYETRLRENLPRIREALDNATRRSGRGEGAVTLVAVTKAHPPEALEAALSLGLRDLGENRLEEMEGKVRALIRRNSSVAFIEALLCCNERRK